MKQILNDCSSHRDGASSPIRSPDKASRRCKKHPYYEHGRRTKIQSGLAEKIYNCDPHRILAMKAEELVWANLENLLSGNLSDELLAAVMRKKEQISFTHEIERLKNKTFSINSQVEALTLRLAELPKEVSAAPIYKQMEKLDIDKRELDVKILKLKDAELEKEIPTDAISYQKLLEVIRDEKTSGLTTAKKLKIVSCLIERIEIFPERLEIHYGLGRSKIKRELVYANSHLYKPADGSTSLTFGGLDHVVLISGTYFYK